MKAAIFILIVLFSSCGISQEKLIEDIPGKIIRLEQLVEMFDDIKQQGHWNMSGDMVWGYFFTDHDPAKLKRANELLIKHGYKFVNIFISQKESPSELDLYWLHVEKIETHSPKSLDKRNDELYLFAHEQGLLSYDGMDVGPVQK